MYILIFDLTSDCSGRFFSTHLFDFLSFEVHQTRQPMFLSILYKCFSLQFLNNFSIHKISCSSAFWMLCTLVFQAIVGASVILLLHGKNYLYFSTFVYSEIINKSNNTIISTSPGNS
jgi:hypothetical protein